MLVTKHLQITGSPDWLRMSMAQEPLRCADVVDAYIRCSLRASEACAGS